jgi:hypothetical protein
MSGLVKRITAGAVTVAATAGLLTVGAAPAAAGTVTQDYRCVWMRVVVRHTFDITITVPATVTRGRPFTVTATVVSRHPVSQPHPAGEWTGRHTITLGGASSGSVTVDPMSSPPLRTGQPWFITGSTQITLDTAGTVTFRPGDTVFTSPGTLGCQPDTLAPPVPVAATTQVS